MLVHPPGWSLIAELEPLTVAEGHFFSPEGQAWTWTWKGPLDGVAYSTFLGLLIPRAVALFGSSSARPTCSPAREGEEGERRCWDTSPGVAMPSRMPCSRLHSRLGTSPKDTSAAIIKHISLLPKGSPGLKKLLAWQESSDSRPGGHRPQRGKHATL